MVETYKALLSKFGATPTRKKKR